MQLNNNAWEPIAFLSVKLSKSQKNWSTYDRELFAIYTSVKKFRHLLEGRDFTIFTDQKPLIYAFKQKPDKCSPRQLRHLDYISQFSTDIRHTKGTDNDNQVVDALSRIEIDSITSTPLKFEEFALAHRNDSELKLLLQSPSALKLEETFIPILNCQLYIVMCQQLNPAHLPQKTIAK